MSTVNNVKVFVKDTADLWKYEARYLKHHWKGLVIVSGLVIGAELGSLYYQQKRWEKRTYKDNHKKDDRVKVEYVVET